jgi:hypothetical protein
MTLQKIIDQIDGEVDKAAKDQETVTHRRARFIPCNSLSKGEERLTSITLAVLSAVPEFAEVLMKSIGQTIGKRSTIDCFIELNLHKDYKTNKSSERPDGLIIHTNGKRHWVCLVEAKTGGDELNKEQMEKYLQLANKISSSKGPTVDALLTITNDFVAVPEHHPMSDVQFPKGTPKLKLIHWSWTYIQTQAEILLSQDDFEDPTKRVIIEELIEYMKSPKSGVQQFTQMNADWKPFVDKLRSSEKFKLTVKTDAELLENSVGAWHQECRDIALLLSREVRQEVRLKLSRKHLKDPKSRIADDIKHLLDTGVLSCEIEVPNAAAPITISVNLNGMMLEMSMLLDAPQEKHRDVRKKTRFKWLMKQLGNEKLEPLRIQSIGSRNKPNSAYLPYTSLLKDFDDWIDNEVPSDPVKFKVIWAVDMSRTISSRKAFIQCIEDTLQPFYKNVVEKIKAYQPSVPEMKDD